MHEESMSDWKVPAILTILILYLTVFAYFFLDAFLAKYVLRLVGQRFIFSEQVSNIPDLLFGIVCVTTILAWAVHLGLYRKSAKSNGPDMFELIGYTVPLVFLAKFCIKYIVGRVNTRVWLLSPESYGLHWFHGGGDFSGFPSGHMAVFTVLVLAIARYFPGLRSLAIGFLSALAITLLITEYHFFSDILAGVYLGFMVDLVIYRSLSAMHLS